MLEILAREYQCAEHEASFMMPALIYTMQRAYTEICQGEDPWTALGNFINAWYDYARGIRADLVSEPPVQPAQKTEYACRWAAFCAASVDFLCERYSVPCPAWVSDPRYILQQPWSGSNSFPAISEQHVATTPSAFARRNIFCGNGLFRNKYEIFEWMLEARSKGITDLQDIRRYARQKERSMHGV